MSRYIEVDAYIKYCEDEWIPLNIDAVNAQPTADVVEVKRGRWIKDRLCSTSGGTYGVRRCSVCEDYFQDIGYGWNFCPNCGSDMRERRNDDKGISD